MSDKKVEWTKPHLVILARGTPEEAVLKHCKRIGEFSTTVAEEESQTGCDKGPLDGNCGACLSRSGS